jgi:6-phosphogluconate dehydrogenase
MATQQDFGLIGLAVMGQNLALNVESKGFSVAVFNRTAARTREFMAGPGKGKNIAGVETVEEFLGALKRPRKIMLMVKAGQPVDDFIDLLLPHLDRGDLIIDGGNSFFEDTIRRSKMLDEKGLLYIGAGVSGGEEGARHGPSIMPGGQREAYELVAPILKKIAAQVDGEPCCTYIGPDGAGHYVKMVHNGIEYGDMQLIAEAYFILKNALNLDARRLHDVFAAWNEGELNSYLIEITRDIFTRKDEETGQALVEVILDKAGQKGTGKWTVLASLDAGMPLTLIAEAVYSRCISALKDARVAASKIIKGPKKKYRGDKKAFVEDIRKALLASKIVSYAQGFMLMRQASDEYKWNLNYGGVALVWRGGCIIRSAFLDKIKEAFDKNPALDNLLLDDYFKGVIDNCQPSWRKAIVKAIEMGIPVPAFATALSFFDGYRTARLPANLLQAQRDYFGAHTYERTDRPRGEWYHTNWTGKGGDVSASTYTV